MPKRQETIAKRYRERAVKRSAGSSGERKQAEREASSTGEAPPSGPTDENQPASSDWIN
jgi:hypothetical protein